MSDLRELEQELEAVLARGGGLFPRWVTEAALGDIRERLERRLAWLGPDLDQGIESAMRAIEGDESE